MNTSYEPPASTGKPSVAAARFAWLIAAAAVADLASVATQAQGFDEPDYAVVDGDSPAGNYSNPGSSTPEAFGDWTITSIFVNPGSGTSLDTTGAPGQVVLGATSVGPPGPGSGTIRMEITTPATIGGTVFLDFNYDVTSGQSDFIIYAGSDRLDPTPTFEQTFDADTIQNNFSFPVAQGDVFGFEIEGTAGASETGAGFVTLLEFSFVPIPEPSVVSLGVLSLFGWLAMRGRHANVPRG